MNARRIILIAGIVAISVVLAGCHQQQASGSGNSLGTAVTWRATGTGFYHPVLE